MLCLDTFVDVASENEALTRVNVEASPHSTPGAHLRAARALVDHSQLHFSALDAQQGNRQLRGSLGLHNCFLAPHPSRPRWWTSPVYFAYWYGLSRAWTVA